MWPCRAYEQVTDRWDRGSYSATHMLGLNFTKSWAESLAIVSSMALTWSERNYCVIWRYHRSCAFTCVEYPSYFTEHEFALACVQNWNPFTQLKISVYGYTQTHASSNVVTLEWGSLSLAPITFGLKVTSVMIYHHRASLSEQDTDLSLYKAGFVTQCNSPRLKSFEACSKNMDTSCAVVWIS